jgi:hypothetical protein
MTSYSNSKNMNVSDKKENINQKDDSDLSNIDNSDLYLFLQFYFTDAHKNLKKILSESVITKISEVPKITSSLNFWLNFGLNFKDNSFVDLLLNKGDKASFCKKTLKKILEDIVKFMFEHFRSEQAFDKIMKNNFNKLYELILRFKDIIDNVYLSSLRNEIFTGVKKEEKNNIIENNANNLNLNLEHNLIRPNMAESDEEDIANSQFNDNNNNNNIPNINNVINNNNIIINNIKIINNNQENIINSVSAPNNTSHVKDTENNELNMIIEKNNNEDKNEIHQEKNENKINNEEEIYPYKIASPNLNYEEIKKLFINFCYFTNFNLLYFQVVFYEKVGYSFLDYNGNFLWADDYTTYILFEEENTKKLNLFNVMTDFSKYILKKKYNDKFFDFQDENNRIRVFTYTIDGGKIKEKEAIKMQEKLYEELNKIKTLVSRATPVLLTAQNGSFIACILLETKYSFYRQNFDFFYWKSDWNNQ